jgi:eukaryotic-like serine/threonine-protein kinase
MADRLVPAPTANPEAGAPTAPGSTAPGSTAPGSTAPEAPRALAAPPAADPLELAVAHARVEAALFGEASPVRVGRYALIERAGAGGMGVVWSAWDPELGRGVALKLASSGDAGARARARDEGRALARLSHPNVVPIYDVLEADHGVFLVMELVQGDTLRAFAASAPPVAALVRAYRQAGEGLAAAHGNGLIHRDFKPDNAILGADGRVRVLDFGLAHEVASGGATPDLAGTPRYMAPEQRLGGALTAAVDQYALCVALREAVTARGAVPRWLEPILARGSAESPAARYASMTELVRALALDPATRWRRRTLAAAGVVALGAVAGAFALGRSRDDAACGGGPALIAEAWGAAPRAAVVLHLAGLRSPYAAETAPRVVGALDGYAGGWLGLHRAACQAHRRGEISDALLDRRAGCLARRRAALSAVGEVARGVVEPALPGLVTAIGELPELAACQDDDALVNNVAPPPVARAAEVAAIGAAIAEADVARAAGQYDVARGRADAAVTQARAVGYRPAVARALLVRGRVALSTLTGDHGAADFAAATRDAMAVGDEPLAIEAFARHAWVVATSRGPEHATDGLELVDAMLERLGDRARFARALLHLNLGSVALARGDRAAAQAVLEQARGESSGLAGDGAIELTAVLANLLTVVDDPARRAGLADELVATRTRLVGPNHPMTLSGRTLAASLLEDPGRARAALEAACTNLAHYHPSLGAKIGECGYDAAWLAIMAGDRDAARASAQLVVAASGTGAQPVYVAAARAALQLADGDFAGAAGALVAIQHREAAEPETWWHQLYLADAAAVEAVARHQGGDREAASRALATAERTYAAIAGALPRPVRVRRAAVVQGVRERLADGRP